jgi:hypothetical protein
MPDYCANVNVWSVLVATLASFLLGGVWYSNALFAPAWIRGHGWSEAQVAEKKKGHPLPCFATAILTSLVSCWIMDMAIAGAKIPADAFCAAGFAAVCWLAFTMPETLCAAMFSGSSKLVWRIDAGFELVRLIIAAEILVHWPRG